MFAFFLKRNSSNSEKYYLVQVEEKETFDNSHDWCERNEEEAQPENKCSRLQCSRLQTVTFM